MAEMAVLNNVMTTSAKKRKPGLLSRCLAVVNKSTAKATVKYVAAPLALWLAAQGMAQATDPHPPVRPMWRQLSVKTPP